MPKATKPDAELERRFKSAVDFIQNLPQDGPHQAAGSCKRILREETLTFSANEKLEFYGLFKQATQGPNETKKPSMLNVVAKAKWDAWTKLGKMGKEEAMRKYIKKVIEVSKKIPGKESDGLRKELEGYFKYCSFF